MEDIRVILEKNDVSELKFYLDYVEQLIEMFEKRNVKIQELYEEKQLLVQKIEDLEQ
jgi:flagellar biosynthesis/type III secretory pathway chaperone